MRITIWFSSKYAYGDEAHTNTHTKIKFHKPNWYLLSLNAFISNFFFLAIIFMKTVWNKVVFSMLNLCNWINILCLVKIYKEQREMQIICVGFKCTKNLYKLRMEVLSINILNELVEKCYWNDELNAFKLSIKELILVVEQNSMIFCWMTQQKR